MTYFHKEHKQIFSAPQTNCLFTNTTDFFLCVQVSLRRLLSLSSTFMQFLHFPGFVSSSSVSSCLFVIKILLSTGCWMISSDQTILTACLHELCKPGTDSLLIKCGVTNCIPNLLILYSLAFICSGRRLLHHSKQTSQLWMSKPQVANYCTLVDYINLSTPFSSLHLWEL